ncbi:MAG: hypothetical protein EOO47_10135, partial [Flavobacterium sp.]
MKTKLILIAFILFGTYSEEIFAQAVITKPNGDVIPNPNLRVVNKGIKVNLTLLKNVSALKLSGKTTAEIVKALKTEKVTAKDAFKTVKETSTPDAENIATLCFAGYNLSEIIDALFVDGYTATAAVGLLKNAENCDFSRPQLLRIVMSKYALRFSALVPIIQSNYARDPKEVVYILAEISPLAELLLEAIRTHRLAPNAAEICRILKGRASNFDKNHLGEVLQKLMRVGFGVDKFNDIADGFLNLGATPTETLEAFKRHYYNATDVRTATYLAEIAKHLKLTRDETATFLRRYSYTATQVLDALQAVYG